MGSYVSPMNGIMQRAMEEGILVVAYPDSDVKKAEEAARLVEVCIVVGGTSATEFVDRPTLHMHDDADDLVFAVAKACPVTIVLMQTPGAVVMPWLGEVRAVLNLFLAGETTGSAWAEVLFGGVSPSSKLPIAFPLTEADTIRPTPQIVPYSEGLFTSYRNQHLNFSFPFGHGLSYTRFTFGAPRVVDVSGGSDADAPWPGPVRLRVILEVRNVGERRGAEVVQAYLEFLDAGPDTPARMLRAFHKTRVLLPGEAEDVSLDFTVRDLSLYVVGDGWKMHPHGARAHIGASSQDIRQVVSLPARLPAR